MLKPNKYLETFGNIWKHLETFGNIWKQLSQKEKIKRQNKIVNNLNNYYYNDTIWI